MNAWVDSYLDALLSAGLSTEHIKKAAEERPARDADTSIAAKYYVNTLLNVDEDAIKDAWSKVCHKSGDERDARLQYLSWRVWGMRRRNALVQQARDAEAAAEDESDEVRSGGDEPPANQGPVDLEDIERLLSGSALPRLAVKPPAAGGSDHSDSEERELVSPETPGSASFGAAEEAAEQGLQVTGDRVPKLYCVLVSMHGLVRGEAMELGKDPDTGGQVKYVVELAKALSRHPAVHRVDLLTRLVRDPKVDASYGKLEEALTEPTGQLGGAYIARIPCGPVNTYLRKEQLWPYIREFADNALTYVCTTMAKLSAAGEPCELYDIHGHYADAGEAAALMSYTLGVDMVLTGHSLGRNKLDHLLKSGTMSRSEIEASYAIGRRIEGEERALDAALLVFTSTHQEVKDQWGLYDGYNPDLERVVRTRVRRGRHFPVMRVIPPGLDFSNLKITPPPDPWEAGGGGVAGSGPNGLKSSGSSTLLSALGRRPRRSSNASASASTWGALAGGAGGEAEAPLGPQTPEAPNADLSLAPTSPRGSPKTPSTATGSAAPPADPFARAPPPEDPPIWRSIFKFLRNPRKPVILAMSRPDAKKNITTLVKAYGGNKALREIANLVLVMGNREVIDGMAPGSAKVLESVLKLIDAYDLYGSVAYPKRHTQDDISDIYLLPAATRGVFVNIALQEPFGLTLIEAAAHGVPIVATKNGGPVDIVHTLHNGQVVDPTNEAAVADALLNLLTNGAAWDECSASGVANINAYSWSSHCVKCLNTIETEKASAVKRTKNAQLRTNYSASLDDFSFITSSGSFSALRDGTHSFSAGDNGGPDADAAAGAGAGGRSGSGSERHPLLSPRSSAHVVGQSFTTDDIQTTSEPPALQPLSINNSGSFAAAGGSPHTPEAAAAAAAVGASPRAARGADRPLASTSVPLTGAYGGSAGAEPPHPFVAAAAAAALPSAAHMGAVRDKYVVFVLDSADSVSRLRKLLARKAKALMGLAAAGHSVGLGVAAAFSLSDTAELLKSAGLGLADLDFAITNSGSEVWYCGPSATGGSGSGTAGGPGNTGVLDEQYDHTLDSKWDLQSVRRVLAQCLRERNFLVPSAPAGAAQPRIRVEANGGAHQLVVTLRPGGDAAAAAAAGAGGLAMSASDQLALIGRLKRRLRRSGLRTQVVAQLDGADIKLHITPLRGSRALALRHLTYKHKVDMTSLVLVCCARDLRAGLDGAAGVARFACSDMEDLVAGVQGVLVVPPPAGAEGAEGFPLDLSLYTHDDRLQLLRIAQ